MSLTTQCRLCLQTGADQKQLYDESGKLNLEIFNKMKTFFNPKFLNKRMAICPGCWQHISKFHQLLTSFVQNQGKPDDNSENSLEGALMPLQLTENTFSDSPYEAFEHHPQNEQDEKIKWLKTEYDTEDLQTDTASLTPDIKEEISTEEYMISENAAVTAKKECGVCNKLFSSAFLLREHMLCHERVKLYKCPACPVTSKYLSSIKRHAQMIHPDLGSDEMKDSNFVVSDNKANKVTIKRNPNDCDEVIAQWKSNLECGICKQSQTNYLTLKQHFSLEHANDKAHILCCQRKLGSRYAIADHAKFHMNPESFKCHKCGKSFKGSGPLRLHINIHTHDNQQYKCLSCARPYKLLKMLNRHLRVAHPQVWSARQNISNFYESMQVTEETVPNERRSYRTAQDSDHIISQWRANLECGICQKSYRNFSDLTKHFRLEHNKEKVHVLCCERKLLSRFHVVEHASWHLNPESYKCRKCGKCYTTRNLLMEHVRCLHPTNGSKNKYVCSICEKVCRSPLNLKEHMASHSTTNLYNCPACTYTCNQRSNLNKHLKSKHLQVWMEGNGKKKNT